MKTYEELIERYQDLQSEIDHEKKLPASERSELLRMQEEYNDLFKLLDTNFKDEFNKY